MPPDRRGEIPSGYTWKECPSIRAKFLMPETWFFKQESAPGTQGFFLTREVISGDSFTVSTGNIALRTTNPRGYFITGLSINVLSNLYQIAGIRPSVMAGRYMTSQADLTPTSQMTQQKEGSLFVFRRYFRSGSRVVMGQRMEPTNFYIEFTGNDLTGTAYHMAFETPSVKWGEDAKIAKIMIERRVLDPNI